MKMVIATPLYPPEIGGPATDAAALHIALTRLGHESVVCQFSRVQRLPKIVRHLVYGWQVFRSAHGASCIIAFDVSSAGVPATLIARLRRIPLIARVPGDYAWEQGRQRFGVVDTIDDFQNKRYGFAVELLRRAQRFVVRSAVLVVAPSDYFKHILAGWGVAPEHLARIYLGLDFSEKVTMPSHMPEGKILFSLGRFVPWKGFAMLVELMPKLPDEWHLIIAGDGPLRPALERQARERGIAQRVTFTGAVPHAEALGWYRRADAFVLNTSFESFSFQILEALAAGVPVITTRIGSIPELVTDGVEGVLCAPNDAEAFKRAILSTQTESEIWSSRRVAAKQKAQSFSIDASARSLAEAILSICA